MISDRSRQDPELDNFLRRVEDIDEAKRSKVERSGKPSRADNARAMMMSDEQYKERDLREARRLLQRDDRDDFDEQMVVDQSTYNDDDELAYKSAYNYEKTYSPKKPNYNINDLDLDREVNAKVSRTGQKGVPKEEEDASFTVSKDDYLLLQRLKKDVSSRHQEIERKDSLPPPSETNQRSMGTNSEKSNPSSMEPKKQTMPSRGKPRGQTVNVQYDIEIDMDAPMLPPRHSEKQASTQNDAYEERLRRMENRRSSPLPPKLPTRPTADLEEPSTNKNDHSDGEDMDDAPALPSRANARNEPSAVARDRKPVATKKDKLSTPQPPQARGTSQITLQSVKPEPITLIDLEDESDDASLLEEKVSRTSHTIPSRTTKPSMEETITKSHSKPNVAPVPPTSRKLNEPVSFISSLNNNKLSSAHSQLPETPKKKQTGHSLDYLESVQLKSPSTKSPKATPTKPRISNIPRSDSFINSALNSDLKLEKKHSPETTSKNAENSGKVPPPIRSKPSNLNKSIPPPTAEKPSFLQKTPSNPNKETETNDESSRKPPPVKSKPALLFRDDTDLKVNKPLVPQKPDFTPKSEKPLPPSKPRNLSSEPVTGGKEDSEETENSTEGLRSFKLRSTGTKIESKVPPKIPSKSSNISFGTLKPVAPIPMTSPSKTRQYESDGIEMPKLRSVNGTSHSDNFGTDGKHTPPVVPKRKPTIPEALLNAKSLKKTTQSSNSSNGDSDIPEALARRNALNKSKVAPAVPTRKISMPEALKKANKLKAASRGDDVGIENENTSEQDTTDDSINSKLEAVISLHQRKTFGGSTTPNAPKPLRRVRTTQAVSGSASPQLTHITKNRAKGPRRKLPSKI